MEGLFIIGIFLILFGMIAMINGKIPFIKTYSGVKNITLHSRIIGGAFIVCGILLIPSHIMTINSILMSVIMLGVCIVTIILQILLKVI